MVASVSELIVPRTADAIVTEQLAVLDAEDFPVTSWQPGSAPRDLVKADATAMARLATAVEQANRKLEANATTRARVWSLIRGVSSMAWPAAVARRQHLRRHDEGVPGLLGGN